MDAQHQHRFVRLDADGQQVTEAPEVDCSIVSANRPNLPPHVILVLHLQFWQCSLLTVFMCLLELAQLIQQYHTRPAIDGDMVSDQQQ